MKKIMITGLTTLTLVSTMFAYSYKPYITENGYVYGLDNDGGARIYPMPYNPYGLIWRMNYPNRSNGATWNETNKFTLLKEWENFQLTWDAFVGFNK